GYFTLDRQGNIRLVNLAGATLIGIERSRLVNKNFGLFVSQESSRIFNAFLKEMFETHPKVKCELGGSSSNGTKTPDKGGSHPL
ncbi:MAG: PAS domain-containing protein, partial [Armatimonadota bacterium]